MRRLCSLLATVALLASCPQERPSPPAAVRTERPSPSPTAEGSPEPRSRFQPNALELELRPFLSGLDQPLLLTHAGDGSERLYVVEQVGRVRIVEGGRVSEEAFLDISDRI